MAIVDERVTRWGDASFGTGELHVFYDDASAPTRQINRFEVQNAAALFPVRLVVVSQATNTVLRDQTFPAGQLTTLTAGTDFPAGLRYTNNHTTRTSSIDVRVAYPA